MKCHCCNGDLPAYNIWSANRHAADECDGSVDERNRCRAFSRDELWQGGYVYGDVMAKRTPTDPVYQKYLVRKDAEGNVEL